jgi:hypothetical protein
VPSDRVLDAIVERIMTGNPLPAARIAGEGLVRMGKALYRISKLFRQDQWQSWAARLGSTCGLWRRQFLTLGTTPR